MVFTIGEIKMNRYERDWAKIMTQNYVQDIHDPEYFWWSLFYIKQTPMYLMKKIKAIS